MQLRSQDSDREEESREIPAAEVYVPLTPLLVSFWNWITSKPKENE